MTPLNIGGALKNPLLVVHAARVNSPFGVDEFDDPKLIALAVEGFCPYVRHDGVEKIERVEVLTDGRVRCPSSGIIMRFEFREDPLYS